LLGPTKGALRPPARPAEALDRYQFCLGPEEEPCRVIGGARPALCLAYTVLLARCYGIAPRNSQVFLGVIPW
jgi:hypothetical protein